MKKHFSKGGIEKIGYWRRMCLKMYEKEDTFVFIQDGKVKGIYKNGTGKVSMQRENNKNFMEGDGEA